MNNLINSNNPEKLKKIETFIKKKPLNRVQINFSKGVTDIFIKKWKKKPQKT